MPTHCTHALLPIPPRSQAVQVYSGERLLFSRRMALAHKTTSTTHTDKNLACVRLPRTGTVASDGACFAAGNATPVAAIASSVAPAAFSAVRQRRKQKNVVRAKLGAIMRRVRSKTRSPSFVFSPSCRLARRRSLTAVCIFALFVGMWVRLTTLAVFAPSSKKQPTA